MVRITGNSITPFGKALTSFFGLEKGGEEGFARVRVFQL
jgi:hypothetical protein